MFLLNALVCSLVGVVHENCEGKVMTPKTIFPGSYLQIASDVVSMPIIVTMKLSTEKYD